MCHTCLYQHKQIPLITQKQLTDHCSPRVQLSTGYCSLTWSPQAGTQCSPITIDTDVQDVGSVAGVQLSIITFTICNCIIICKCNTILANNIIDTCRVISYMVSQYHCHCSSLALCSDTYSGATLDHVGNLSIFSQLLHNPLV